MADKIKIMMIDDEKDLCDFVKLNLEESGEFEVTTVNESSKALEIFEQVKPDVVLVDVVMPKVKGTEVIRQLKRSGKGTKVIIIVASGLGEMVYQKKDNKWKWMPNTSVVRDRGDVIKEKDPEVASEAYGVDNFVAKPFSTELLVDAIKEALDKKRPQEVPDNQSVEL